MYFVSDTVGAGSIIPHAFIKKYRKFDYLISFQIWYSTKTFFRKLFTCPPFLPTNEILGEVIGKELEELFKDTQTWTLVFLDNGRHAFGILKWFW